jgi:DNA-binding CsgD family transcriptional regulator
MISPSTHDAPPRALTAMERQVIRLVSLGCSLPDMAAILGRSMATVDNHRTRGMRKLGVHKAAELTRVAIRLGITSLDDCLTPRELEKLQNGVPHAAQGTTRG